MPFIFTTNLPTIDTIRDRIYRVTHAFRSVAQNTTPPAPTPEEFQVWGCAPAGPALKSDFPAIEEVVQFMSPNSLLLQYGDKRVQQDDLLFIDSTAFNVFSWKMLYGDPHTALTAPNSIVLTQSVSEKFFGKTSPVGQILRMNNEDNFTVTGVMEDVPPNSQFSFSGLISMTTMVKYRPEIFESWGYVDFYTYLLLKENADIGSLQSQATAFVQRHNQEDKGYAISF